MVSYNYLGYGVTNSEGIAKLDHNAQGQEISHSYTGVGAGEIDVLASLDNPIVEGSIVSETLNVWDYMFYDDGITGTTLPSNWENYDWQIERDETGTKMTHNKTSGWCALRTSTFTFHDCCIEFDMVDYSGNVYFQIATNNNTQIAYGRSLFPTTPVHIKIEVVGNIITTTVGTQVLTDDITSATKDTLRFQFANNTQGRMMKIKNFKMYPL